jgi:group I intron endonuclease
MGSSSLTSSATVNKTFNAFYLFTYLLETVNMIGIYKVTSPSGKIYIGQSTNIVQRWEDYNKMIRCKRQTRLYNSFIKYGVKNHIFEIIEECNEHHLLERETYWKKYYKVLEIPSLCCRMDGKGGKLSEYTRNKMSKAKLGKANKYNYTVLQYDKYGNFIKEWDNYLEIPNVRDIKLICFKESYIRINESLWRFKYNENYPNKLSLPQSYINKLNKFTPVIQYDLQGNFIREYTSNSEVKHIFLKSLNKEHSSASIHACCNNKQKTAFGYKWKYKV